jgi:hypothetical protein
VPGRDQLGDLSNCRHHTSQGSSCDLLRDRISRRTCPKRSFGRRSFRPRACLHGSSSSPKAQWSARDLTDARATPARRAPMIATATPRGQARRTTSPRPYWRFGSAPRARQRAHPTNFAFHPFCEVGTRCPATGAFREGHRSCAVTRLVQPRRDENDRDGRDLMEIGATVKETHVFRTTRALISSLRRVPRWSRRTSAAGGACGAGG